jgi:hypothetical protein
MRVEQKPLSSRKIVYPMRTHQETFPYLLVNIGSGGAFAGHSRTLRLLRSFVYRLFCVDMLHHLAPRADITWCSLDALCVRALAAQ